MNLNKYQQIIFYPQFYLIVITIGFAIINFLLFSQSNPNSDELIFNLIVWAGLLSLLWKKKRNLPLNFDYFSTVIGFLLIIFVLAKSTSLFWFESSFIKVMPLLQIIGLFLIFSSFKNLKFYLREIIIISILAIPSDSLERVINHLFLVNIFTAKFASVLLWYFGIQVSNEGAMLYFSDSSVLVDYPCTGVKSALILLKLSILAVCIFTHKWRTILFLMVSAIIIGFGLGVIRASILSLIVKDEILFNYWHGDNGGSIFATVSMVLFAILYNFLIPKIDNFNQ